MNTERDAYPFISEDMLEEEDFEPWVLPEMDMEYHPPTSSSSSGSSTTSEFDNMSRPPAPGSSPVLASLGGKRPRDRQPATDVMGAGASAMDPISPAIVGAVDSEKLFKRCREVGLSWKWIDQVEAIMSGPEDTWCGGFSDPYGEGEESGPLAREEKTSRVHAQRTAAEYHSSLIILQDSILQRVDNEEAYGNSKGVVKIFTVLKDGLKLRVIANAIQINKLFGDSPPLCFATVDDLFHIFSYFGTESRYTVADFRHWFHQLKLPNFAKKFFRVVSGAGCFQFKTWPMGFKWSPFCAQAHSMALAAWAIHTTRSKVKLYCVSPLEDADRLPPFWFITKNPLKTAASLKRVDVVGFVVFWYDNLLLVTGDSATHAQVSAALTRVTTEVRAHWKAPKKLKAVHGITEGFGGAFLEQSRASVDYLGIHFEFDEDGRPRWRHADKNIEKWRLVLEDITESSRDRRTFLQAARLAGIVTWNWRLEGGARRDMQIARRMLQVVALTMWSKKKKWKDTATHVSHSLWRALEAKVRSIINGNELRDRTSFKIMDPTQVRVWASDACTVGIGRVNLVTGHWVSERLDPNLFSQHISKKELLSALEALSEARRGATPGTLVVLGVDNKATVSCLNKLGCPFDKKLDRQVARVYASYTLIGCLWKVFFIKGIENPADKPSRFFDGTGAPEVELVSKALVSLKDAARVGWVVWEAV